MSLLDTLIPIGLIAGGLFVGYIVSIQGVKAVINREAKVSAVQTILQQVGLKNAKVKDFNDLTDQGLKNLVSFVIAIKQPIGQPASMSKAMQDAQAMAQWAATLSGQMGGGERQNVPIPGLFQQP